MIKTQNLKSISKIITGFIYFYKFVSLIGYYEKMKELELIYNSFQAGSRIVTDSREVKNGDIFIALKGENHNGNTFAEKAMAQGAKHIIIDEDAYNTAPQCVLVPTHYNSCNNWQTTIVGN